MPATSSGFLTLAGLLLLLAGTVSGAEAQEASCRQLEARLASLPAGDGNDGLFQRYDAAVAEQREELSIARQRASDLDCGFAFGFGSDACQAINLKVERMEANLADLQRKRVLLSKRSAADNGGERRRLLAAIEARGCDGARSLQETVAASPAPPVEPVPPDEGGLFDRLSRGSIEYVSPPGQTEDDSDGLPAFDEDSVRAYRTMCVRTCDGYYFPMSASSSRNDFARDQGNCESICPGTEIRTYYQRSVDYDIDRMMSTATEEPYTDLSTAYLYRSADVARPAACGCGKVATAQNFSIIAGEGSAAAEVVAAKPAIPHPWQRPDAAADPETLANVDGRFGSRQIAELLKPRLTKRPPAGERKVRVVGPTFLPDPSVATDRPVPAPRISR